MRVFYFGTYEASGHCLWGPGPVSASLCDVGPLLPWWPQIDGALTPSDREGEAALHHKHGWTALAFANYTDDQRPGSNAAFFFDAPLTFDEAVAVARATFPQIVRRFQFKIAETAEPVSH